MMKTFSRVYAAFAPLLLLFATSVTIGCGSGVVSAPITAAPTVSSLSPATATAGSLATVLAVTGSNFVAGAEITWGGNARTTTYVSSTSLQTTLSAADFASAAMVQVGVVNPQSAGGTASNTLPFLISASLTPNPVPVLTSVSPASVPVGSPATTVALAGSNFVAGSTVSINGSTSLSTTFLSATSLTAVIPASALLNAGNLALSVTNPLPGGGSSASVNFTVVAAGTSGQTVINVTAHDLAWDPVNQVIYLSLPSIAGPTGNAIQVLNPSTGALGNNVFAGSEPNLLAVSNSSKYLYASLDGSSALQRFTLPALTKDINIPLGAASFYGAYVAMDLQASPAADGTVAVVRGTPGTSPEEEGGVLIFDDAVQRANQLCGFIQIGCTSSVGGGLYDSIQWSPTAIEMYLLNNEDTGFDFYTAQVGASGFSAVTDHGALAGGFGDAIHYDATTKLLYTDYGTVIDPATGLKAGEISASGLALPDGKTGIIFFLGQTSSSFGSGTYTVESFDINRLTPIGSLTIKNVSGTPTHFIRWGANGLAFTTSQGFGSTTPGAVYLVSGSFVTSAVRQEGLVPEDVHRIAAR